MLIGAHDINKYHDTGYAGEQLEHGLQWADP